MGYEDENSVDEGLEDGETKTEDSPLSLVRAGEADTRTPASVVSCGLWIVLGQRLHPNQHRWVGHIHVV